MSRYRRLWQRLDWWNHAPPLSAAVVAGVTCFGGLFLAYVLFVHQFFFGLWSGPFLISTMFGVPESSVAAGILPVHEFPASGWDGQFYYHQSNDPFLFQNPREHNPYADYRYRRNLIPILAYVTSRAVGFGVTPALWYQTWQFALTAVGFGALVWLCRRENISCWWSCVWLFSGGLIHSLFRGLPDAPADALFLLSLAALYQRNLTFYLIAASLLVLCREGYAVFAAGVFILSAANLITWKSSRPRLIQVALTTAPGVVVIAWAIFIQLRLQALGDNVPYSSPANVLLPPFSAWWRFLQQEFAADHLRDTVYLTFSGLTLFVIGLIACRQFRARPMLAATVPYILLMSMTGAAIWSTPLGHLKACSAVLVTGVLLLGVSHSVWLRIALYGQLVIGLYYGYQTNVLLMTKLPPVSASAESLVESMWKYPGPAPPADLTPPPTLTDGRCRLECVAIEPAEIGLRPWPLFGRHRLWLYRVTATNTGDSVWPDAWLPDGRVTLAFQLRDETGAVLSEGRRRLRGDVRPGESAEFLAAIPRPRRPGVYCVTIGLVQEGRVRFADLDPAAEFSAEIRGE